MTGDRSAPGAVGPGRGEVEPDFDRDGDCYRRRIVCRAEGATTVVADLEDDFHHFRVRLRHDGSVVTGIECESVRWPWSTCPEAARNLEPLVGMPLPARFTDAARHAEPRLNCTHQFDCAAHAAVHARRGTRERRYDVEVPARGLDERSRARLWVDRRLRLAWTVEGMRHVDPEPPFDRAPATGFMRWADAELDPEDAEAAIVLKRGLMIGFGRGWPFDEMRVASDAHIGETGVCYTMTPGRSATATRVKGTIRDFGAEPERLVGGEAPSPRDRLDSDRDPERD